MSLFQVGSHRVVTSLVRFRWSATVDRRLVPGWFVSEAEAWAAGVREADRLDRRAGAAGPGSGSPGRVAAR